MSKGRTVLGSGGKWAFPTGADRAGTATREQTQGSGMAVERADEFSSIKKQYREKTD